MGIHDKKSIETPQKQLQRAERDDVTRVQQRIAKLTEAVDSKRLNPIGVKIAERQRQHSQLQMAQLRSDAVQARRLAEHIESLSRRTTQRTRNRTMTESSIFDPEHSQHPRPDIKNKPTAGRGALTFNPLHPSQELPPEQLIRLLGMESKKTRKHMKTRGSSPQRKPRRAIDEERIKRLPVQPKSRSTNDEQKPRQSQDLQKSLRVDDEPETKTHRSPSRAPQNKPADREERREPQREARSRHHMEYERNEPAMFEQRGPGWLLPALVIGLVAGAVVSASLFWFQSSTTAIRGTPAVVVSSEPRNRQIPNQQPKNQQATRKATSGSAESASPAAKAPVKASAKAPKKAPVKAAGTANNANWQTAIKTEQNHLRRAAEQRLAKQLTNINVSRELADSPTPAANDSASSAEAPAVDIPAAETLPAETPAEGLVSDRNGEMFEESTDFVDSFEGDSVPDVSPADEQDSVLDTAPALDVDTTAAFNHSDELELIVDVDPSSGQDMEAEQSSNGVSDEGSSSVAEDSAAP